MNVSELLKQGEPIFEKIDKAIKDGHFELALKLLDSPQPADWVKSEDSEILIGNKFYYNNIALIEAMMSRLFKVWNRTIMHHAIIVQDKGKFAVTLMVGIDFVLCGSRLYYSGVATEFASSIEYLTIRTPLAFTSATKHACKQIGNLFGRSLNRIYEDETSLPVINVTNTLDDANTKAFEDAKDKIQSMDREQAEAFLRNSDFKWNGDLKRIIQSKTK